MDNIIFEYHFSPGFIGDFVLKDLYISNTFEFCLKFFWYIKFDHLPDNDFERKQVRRFTTIKDKLSEDLEPKIKTILGLNLKIIVPKIVKSDKIIYSTSAHSKSEYYKLEINKEEQTIHIPYNISETLIEGENKELFLNFHHELQSWIEEEFEIASEGKAARFNKK